MAEKDDGTYPTVDDAREAGRDYAVEVTLALLVADRAGGGDPVSFPEFLESFVKTASSEPRSELEAKYGPEAADAFRESLTDRVGSILKLARSVLARVDQMRRSTEDDEPNGK